MYIGSRCQVDEFSSFIEFVNDSNKQRVQWRSDQRLSRNIVRILESDDYRGIGTTAIVLTFLKDLQKNYNPVTHSHLVAYLHKTCYKTCDAIFRDLKKLQNFPEFLELEQLFSEASSFLWQKETFDRYDFQSASIETYIQGIVRNKLLDIISRNLGDSGRRSIWGLLKEVSRIKINRALDIMEIPSPRNRSDYFILVNLYKDVCTSTRGLKEGDSSFKSMMESIAERFNRFCDSSSNSNIIICEEVVQILKNCAQKLRELDRELNSVQRHISSEDEHFESDVEYIPSIETFSSLDKLIDLISDYLDKSLEENLTRQCHETMKTNGVFILHHGLGCKDDKIGLIYKCNQSTIWRFRRDAYSPILNVLRDWNSTIALNNFDDTRLLKILKEVLDTIYHAKLNEMLHIIGDDTLNPSDLVILSDLYEFKNKKRSPSQNLVQEIANKQGVSAVYIDETIKQIQLVLSDALLLKLKEIFDPNLSIYCIENKIGQFVGSWIGIPKQ